VRRAVVIFCKLRVENFGAPYLCVAAQGQPAAQLFGFLLWDLHTLLSSFRKTDSNGLLAARHFFAAATALQFPELHRVHLGLDVLSGGGTVFAG
jgi:hypothetical protein